MIRPTDMDLLAAATNSQILDYKTHISSLQEACTGLNISEGRVRRYVQLLMEFWEKGGRTREHILSLSESWEIIDVYHDWKHRLAEFPGIEVKLRSALRDGPVLQEDELPHNSGNRPRNDAFSFLLAGQFLEAGISVLAVEGISKSGEKCDTCGDITIAWEGRLIDIQCKRPRKESSIKKNVRDARNQIKGITAAPFGLVAIDCSVFLRPPVNW